MKAGWKQNGTGIRVITFGLSEEQNRQVEHALPTREYRLLVTDVFTDLIAVSASALIVNAAALDAEGVELLSEYYTEVGCGDETVFWIGFPRPSKELQRKFNCVDAFEEVVVHLKTNLLNAHYKSQKARDFSRKMADCLQILSLIRAHPGIRTRELVEKLELPTRTVQRYIATLQAAGEWIEYDTAKRGWKLQSGISVLFGDHLR